MSPTPRALTPDEQRQFTAARLLALTHVPYLAHALFAMRPVAAEGLDTFAVDRHWRVYIDPLTLTAWGPAWSAGVLVHEASHLIREHAARADALGSQVDRERWNYATDAAINDDLVEAKIPLPDGLVTPEALELPAAGIEEAYYEALTPQGAPEGAGCGSGAGDAASDWELAPDDTRAPGVSAAAASIARRRVAHDIRESAAKAAGSVPSGLRRWAEAELAPSTLPWRKMLAGAVRHAAALTSGRTTYSYSRPGRRTLPGIVTPAMRTPKVRAAVVVDTSGSMSPTDLAAALTEVNGVIKASGGSVDVITCDVDAQTTRHTRSARTVHLEGGGGTDLRVGINAAERMRERPDIIVVLTDGYTPWPDRRTRARMIVVLIGRNTSAAEVPTWATTVTASPACIA